MAAIAASGLALTAAAAEETPTWQYAPADSIVTGKIESQPLGDILWPITPNQPWSLVYLLSMNI
jgi:hypothetical protein